MIKENLSTNEKIRYSIIYKNLQEKNKKSTTTKTSKKNIKTEILTSEKETYKKIYG